MAARVRSRKGAMTNLQVAMLQRAMKPAGPRYVVTHTCKHPGWHTLDVWLWQGAWVLLWCVFGMVPFALLARLTGPSLTFLLLLPVLIITIIAVIGVGWGLLRLWRLKTCTLTARW
jgi:hypothetical protein